MKLETQLERQSRILLGLEIAYQRMLEMKRQKNSVVVVAQEGKIVRLKP